MVAGCVRPRGETGFSIEGGPINITTKGDLRNALRKHRKKKSQIPKKTRDDDNFHGLI